LRAEALQLLNPDVLKALPQAVQDRAVAGGEPFVPTNTVTRSNGNASLQLTVYKTKDSNTVQAFHAVDEVIKEIQTRNPDLIVNVAFEQASFIEESISGVAREGSLGAFFAMVVILVFLSSGHWASSPRRVTGLVLTVIFGVLLALVVSGQASAPGGLNGTIPENTLIAMVLLGMGVFVGVLVLISPFDLPYPAWRATLVIGVSIPVSVMAAMIVMRWFSPAVHNLLEPGAESSPIIAFLIRLFPANLTLNIMTLSGLTVAIGRVVDDSIVVLENIIRQMQTGLDKRTAIISGVRDVSQAIFVATLVTVVVFLPLGSIGGIIGEFFLPFGLAVTYSLLASFVVAVTVVPVLVFMFIGEQKSQEHESSFMERLYTPVLRWALSSRTSGIIVLVVAVISMFFGFALFGGRPAQFLPDFGEPQIGINVSLPTGTKVLETNQLVTQMEASIYQILPDDERGTVLTVVGGGGQSLESLLTGAQVAENAASITIGISTTKEKLDAYTGQLRAEAEKIFGVENVRVSAASLSQQGFGGFSLVLSGPQEDLEKANAQVVETLEKVEGIANVSSNLAAAGGAPGAGDNAPVTLIRIDGQTAVSYTAELETQNTIGVTQEAITAVKAIPDLPTTIKISQGFQT
ncbi:MAG TPA: efflux RND transporter permease subunit, partial [Phototrophicaceae bacterium]|nr:efflux RND transporter permease subunit [Phototrophicaceae bacterium]